MKANRPSLNSKMTLAAQATKSGDISDDAKTPPKLMILNKADIQSPWIICSQLENGRPSKGQKPKITDFSDVCTYVDQLRQILELARAPQRAVFSKDWADPCNDVLREIAPYIRNHASKEEFRSRIYSLKITLCQIPELGVATEKVFDELAEALEKENDKDCVNVLMKGIVEIAGFSPQLAIPKVLPAFIKLSARIQSPAMKALYFQSFNRLGNLSNPDIINCLLNAAQNNFFKNMDQEKTAEVQHHLNVLLNEMGFQIEGPPAPSISAPAP